MHNNPTTLQERWPTLYQELLQIKDILENHYHEMCDIEFTIERGKLYILNTCIGKRNPKANLRFALQFFQEGKISITEVLTRIKPADVEEFTNPELLNRKVLKLVGKGLPASAGISTGKIALCASDVQLLAQQGKDILFVRNEIYPDDVKSIRHSRGVLTARGGMTSHAALVCRDLNKPSVVGFGQMEIIDSEQRITISGSLVLKKGSWITIDGNSGFVYAGKGELIVKNWRECPELLALSKIIDLAVVYDVIPNEVIGQTWRIRDFFNHSIPFKRKLTQKMPVQRRRYSAFVAPKNTMIKKAWSHLVPVSQDDNYSQIILDLNESLSRLLSSLLGIGKHHHYFRPLWNPKQQVKRKRNLEGFKHNIYGTQFVGFEYFDINRYIHHLIDISHITIFLEIVLTIQSDEWFLDFTNPKGESLVMNSAVFSAYRIFVNNAEVKHHDLPSFYNAIRRREYCWRWFELNETSYDDIVSFLKTWKTDKKQDSHLNLCCEKLGLLRNGQLTVSGQSLIGERYWSQKYEFTEF